MSHFDSNPFSNTRLPTAGFSCCSCLVPAKFWLFCVGAFWAATVAMTRPTLFLLFFLLVCSHGFCGKPQQWGGSYGKGSASSSRWGRWNQQDSWGSRAYGGQDRELVVRVETGEHDKKRRKRSKKEKKRRKSSSSDSSGSSSSSSEKKKKKKGSKKTSNSAALSNSDLEELRAFRRREEIEKIRAEVAASMVVHSPSSHDKGCTNPKQVLTPKTKKLVLAQTRVFDKGGQVQSLVPMPESWEQVAEQLSGHPLPLVKQLLQQINPDSTVPRGKNEVVKLVMAELQNRED